MIESTEYILWATLPQNTHYFDYEYSRSINYGQKQLRNVWESGKTPVGELRGKDYHPHQKPLWLIHRLIKLACPSDGFVLDPMCGSGTTEVICCAEHMTSLCSDISDKYLEVATARWKEISSKDMFSRDAEKNK